MKNATRLIATALFFGAIASSAWCDQLFVTGQTKEGSFEGFEKGRFQFVNAKGRLIKEQAGRVMKMVVAKPVKVTYITSDGKEHPEATLTGYEKRNFVFEDKGAKTTVAQMKMKTIEIVRDDTTEGSGDEPGRYPIPPVDLEAFAGAELTPEQKTALDAFTEAKKIYDDFVTENAALVKKMDALEGPKREDVMNELRKRKNDEQPLRKALVAAYKEMNNVFPEPGEEAPVKAVKAEPVTDEQAPVEQEF